MKNLVSLMIVACILCLASFPAAAKGQSEKAATEKTILQFVTQSHPSWPYNPSWWIWKAMEEATGVKLEVNAIGGTEYNTKLPLLVASGNLPDLMYINSPIVRDKFAESGALLNLKTKLSETPNFDKFNRENTAWVKRFLSGDGGLYVYPNYGYGEGNRCGYLYRADIFSKLGLKVPTTFDELYEVARALKVKYPASYPFAFRNAFLKTGYSMATINLIATQWNTGHMYYFDYGSGQWKFGPTEPNFRDMATALNRLFKEKLIPQDWLTMDTKQWEELMTSDRAFLTIDYVGRIDVFDGQVRKSNPDFSLLFMPPPAGGKNGQRKFAFTSVGGSAIGVASSSKKTAAALKFLDWMYTKEAEQLVSWGKEGETYRTVDGKRKFIGTEAGKRTDVLYGIGTMGTYLRYDYGSTLQDAIPEMQEAYQKSPAYDDVIQPNPVFNTAEQEVVNTVGESIKKYVEEQVSRFIMGDRDLGEWDKYVAEVTGMGVQKIVDIHNAQQKRLDK